MGVKIKSIIKKILGSFFWVDIVCCRESYAIKNGLKRRDEGSRSVFFFTTHKCASTFTPKILACVAKKRDLKLIDYAKYLWHKRDDDVFLYLESDSDRLFRDKGCVFAPLRQWINIEAAKVSDVIIMLRDPRDVLVSMYYSMAFTHELPGNRKRRKEFLKERDRILSITIDQFVVEKSEHFVFLYQQYFDILQVNKNYYFCTYEKMIFNFDDWIRGIENYLGVEFDMASKKVWKTEISPPTVENMSHKRKMLPGDYKNKLQPQTIEILNAVFSKHIKYFENAF